MVDAVSSLDLVRLGTVFAAICGQAMRERHDFAKSCVFTRRDLSKRHEPKLVG